MTLYEKIKTIYSELTDNDFLTVITLQNDSDGKVRKNEHTLYMEDIQQIVDIAQGCGFILESKIDLLQCQYEYQYLYMFVKPT